MYYLTKICNFKRNYSYEVVTLEAHSRHEVQNASSTRFRPTFCYEIHYFNSINNVHKILLPNEYGC